MSRRMRKVPADWVHPTDADGRPIPLFDGEKFAARLAAWDEESAQWAKGYRRDYFPSDGAGRWKEVEAEYASLPFAEWDGDRPVASNYMLVGVPPEARTHFAMYEETSEGTPVSPVFPTAEGLARWLADEKASAFGKMTATYSEWLATILSSDGAPSAYVGPGGVVSGVEGFAKSVPGGRS